MNDRARLPFALVGVLVLTASVGLTATVGTHDPTGQQPVDQAMDGATAAATTELRAAADDAATERAAAPVTRPGNESAGRALDDSQPFRDALRLHVYLAAAERLDGVEVRRGETVAAASLPEVEPSEDGYRNAIERVHVEPAGQDGAALRVEVDDVTVTATSRGERVATDVRSASFVIANPALLLHDRTEQFEERANAPVTERGLGQRVTARLYAVGWTRGYAQYGGAPISTVIDTRHVELATNDALLAEQRAVLGAADPGGDRGVAAAGRRVAVTDALAGSDAEWTDGVLEAAADHGDASNGDGPVEAFQDEPSTRQTTVAVDESADRAYADLVGIEGDDDVADIVERVHTVEARLEADIEELGGTERGGGRPGDDWELVDSSRDRSVDIEETDGSAPTAPDWTTRETAVFEVTVVDRTVRTWERSGETRTTETTASSDYRVRLALQARAMPVEGVPGGDLDGELSGPTERATNGALRDAGGFRRAARVAAVGDEPDGVTIATAEPVIERGTIEADLRPLRERTRNVSTSVSARAVGTGRAGPAEQLRSEIDDRRSELRGEEPDDQAARTLRAVRVGYLGAVDERLAVRSDSHDAASDGLVDAIDDYLDAERLDDALAAHRMATRPTEASFVDPAGNLSLSVETGPSYLPTGEIERERIDARGGGTVHPLATRNVNLFTSPHEQVASSVVDRIPFLGDESVSLETAARTLLAMDGVDVEELDALESKVDAAARHVRGELVAATVREGVPATEANDAVAPDDGASTAERALALADGTATDRAVEAVAEDDAHRERLRLRLESARSEALADDAARPDAVATNDAAAAARETYRDELESILEEGAESAGERARKRALGEKLGSLPAGLPVAPVPGHWWATANVWYVDVGGSYERFAVRADRGGPTGDVTYVREGQEAALVHDGERVHLGYAEPVEFRTETAVVVVVPPGGRGVGDTDGVVDERSPGWPP